MYPILVLKHDLKKHSWDFQPVGFKNFLTSQSFCQRRDKKEGTQSSLCQQDGVLVSRFDQCRFGLRSPGSRKPIRKRTKLVHNIPALHITFGDVFCQCQEEHRRIEGSEAGVRVSSFCETYPPAMVEGLLGSIRTEIGVEMVD